MLAAGEEYHDLATLLREKAAKNEQRAAARFAQETVSYRALHDRSREVAQGLSTAGIGKGDRVAALLFNVPEFLYTWFALAELGAVFVPLNTGLKGEILRYELADAGPRGLVIDRRLWDAYEPFRNALAIEKTWVVGDVGDPLPSSQGAVPFAALRGGGLWQGGPAPAPSDPAAILYTSGTTGPPKGALIPHEKYLRTPREIGARSRLDARSVLFTALPLFHCNAQEMTAITAFEHDLTAAFDEPFHASTYWETAASFGATHVSLLISMINVLFKQPGKPTDRSHTVRTALTAGATKATWPEFERRFGLEIIELYGMTECGCTTLMNPPNAVRLGSIGTPLGFVEARVVGDDGAPVVDGVRGELLVRPTAPNTMFLGYVNKPNQTAEAWEGGWFHTGDYVTRDGDGYFYFVDRKKDVIRRRGENLAPYDVESVLNTHPAVFESVVVGVPSPLGEEDVKAFVHLKPGASATPRELFDYCAQNLPFFMVPKYIEFLDEIPKTANQKAQRYVLRGRRGAQEHDRDTLGVVLRKP